MTTLFSLRLLGKFKKFLNGLYNLTRVIKVIFSKFLNYLNIAQNVGSQIMFLKKSD